MTKIWVFEFNHIQGRHVEPDAYEDATQVQMTFDDTMARLTGAEASGFEGVFFSEHHFGYGLSPSPNLMLAALARETRTFRLGVMGNVLPFHQPWRLAEDLGVLDYLTHGRLEIGMSSGVPPEYPIVNIDPAQARAMYEEIQDFLELSANSRVITFKGSHYNFDQVPVLPRLRPEARRRRWVTLFSEATARRAAGQEHRICSAFVGCENILPVFEAYHEESAKHGFRTGPDDIGLRRQVLVCDTDAQAEELDAEIMDAQKGRSEVRFRPVFERMAKNGGVGMSEGVKKTGTVDAASVGRQAMSKGKDPLAAMISLEDEFIRGSAKTVADRIIDQCRRTGAGHILAHHSPALSRTEVIDMYGRLWPQVLQILTKANVAG